MSNKSATLPPQPTALAACGRSDMRQESGTAYLFPRSDPLRNQHNACAETGWRSPILASEEFCHRLLAELRHKDRSLAVAAR